MKKDDGKTWKAITAAAPASCPAVGPTCGNGVQEGTEQCDGADYGFFIETCEDVYEGFNPDSDDTCPGSALQCAGDCTIDGSLCRCICESDIDCALPQGELIDCGPSYCTPDFCASEDVEDCSCSIGDEGDISGACLGSNFDQAKTGICLTTPFDPGKKDAALDPLCQGFDEEDTGFPRCDFCDFF